MKPGELEGQISLLTAWARALQPLRSESLAA
jgi:hypothetical protein